MDKSFTNRGVGKETRWDRIRKRHCSHPSNSNSKSELIKRLIEKDFIGQKRQNNMLNENLTFNLLNPALVMDIRHQMLKRGSNRRSHKEEDVHQYRKLKNIEACKAHNMNVEERYLENQLKCFREHINRRCKLFKTSNNVRSSSLLIDNSEIMQSLETAKSCSEDFFQSTAESLKIITNLYSQGEENLKNFQDRQDDNRKEDEEGGEGEEKLNGEFNSEINESFDSNNSTTSDSNVVTPDLNEPEMTESEPPDFSDSEKSNLINNFVAEIVQIENYNNTLENNFEQQQKLERGENCESFPNSDNLNFNKIISLQCVHQGTGDGSVLNQDGEHLQDQSSNSGDDLDSIISELAEEALNELRYEEDQNKKQLETNSLERTLTECDDESHDETIKVEQENKGESMNEKEKDSCSTTSLEETNKQMEADKALQKTSQPLTSQEKLVLRKYILKWNQCAKIERVDREQGLCRQSKNRLKKIQLFLDKVRLEKKQLGNKRKTRDQLQEGEDAGNTKSRGHYKFQEIAITKKYQTKIKVQQDIIDLQRLKLERQERVIMELKLSKLSEEAREARNLLKEQLKTVIRVGEPKSKAKAKCLQLIGNLNDSSNDDDDKFDRLQGKAFLAPKFLLNMQERALERNIKHEQAKQRRLQAEAIREAQKIALEEAKRLEDEESKRQRIAALREKRRQEKQAKILREQAHQKYLENDRLAKEFCRRLLLRRVGMEGFKRLLHRKREIHFRCQLLRASLYKKTYFYAWWNLYRTIRGERMRKADELYARLLKRQCLRDWFYELKLMQNQTYVAIDWNEFKITEKVFHCWWAHTQRMQLLEEVKMKQASSHHGWHLKWKVLNCWQQLPQILQLEREAEERRQKWRLKIWELLPDYTPNRVDLPYF